jgi:anti-anti-sigma regulatory factor
VSLTKTAYYADARDGLIKIVSQAIDESASGKIIIEMSAVKQFTSGPLGALVVSARKASEKGGRLVLAASVSEFVGKVLSTATETSANPSYPTVRAALSALSTEAASTYDKAK